MVILTDASTATAFQRLREDLLQGMHGATSRTEAIAMAHSDGLR
ncbi:MULTISPECIES: hypothetical protein [unclassified Arthrobacter]|nr:hypothetical protein [Arthrobacter sp. Bi26]CAH0173900.1 hypothetical protein SRABI26_01260 [Arthrobacter sp. Bi26]